MAKLSKDEIDAIVQRDAPGYHVAARPPLPDTRRRRSPSDARGPDLESMKRKYARAAPAAERSAAIQPDGEVRADFGEPDDEIVLLEPDRAPDPLRRGPGPKAAIISSTEKKIIGLQG